MADVRVNNVEPIKLERAAVRQTSRVVVKEDDEDDDDIRLGDRSMYSGWSSKEIDIRTREYKKSRISELLRSHIGESLGEKNPKNVKEGEFWDYARWAGSVPTGVDVGSLEEPVII